MAAKSSAMDSVEDLLSDRLRQHEKNLQAHRAIVDEQRKWLTQRTPAATAPAAAPGTPPPPNNDTSTADEAEEVAARGGHYSTNYAPPAALQNTVGPSSTSVNSSTLNAERPAEQKSQRQRASTLTGGPRAQDGATSDVFSQLSRQRQLSERAQQRTQQHADTIDAQYTGRPHVSSRSEALAAQREQRDLQDAASFAASGGPYGAEASYPNTAGAADGGKRISIEDRLALREQQRNEKLAALRAAAAAEREARETEEKRAAKKLRIRARTPPPSTSRSRARSATFTAGDKPSSSSPQRRGGGGAVFEALHGESSSLAARRTVREELVQQQRDADELEELVGTPRISAHSAKLAAKRRAKEGCPDGMDIAESLMLRDEQSRAEKWLRIQHQNAIEVPGRPVISNKAAKRAAAIQEQRESMRRERSTRSGVNASNSRLSDAETLADVTTADVTERLYANANTGNKSAQLREIVDANLDCTFAPAITPRAHHLRRKDGHSVGGDLYEQAVARQERLLFKQMKREVDQEDVVKRSSRPKINPVSEMLASRRQESTMERLTRPKRGVDEEILRKKERAHSTPRIDRRSAAMAAQRSLVTERLADAGVGGADGEGPVAHQIAAGAITHAPTTRLDQLHSDAARRDQRRAAEREAAAKAELDTMSFQPSITAAARDVGRGSSPIRRESGGSLAERAVALGLEESDNFLARADRWEQRRRQKAEELRAAKEDEELDECTFEPSTNHNDPGAFDEHGRMPDGHVYRPGSPGGSEYGHPTDGIGTGFGDASVDLDASYASSATSRRDVGSYIKRMQGARDKKDAEAERKAKIFAIGSQWTGQPTVPVEPNLGTPVDQRRGPSPTRGGGNGTPTPAINPATEGTTEALVDALVSTPYRSVAAPSGRNSSPLPRAGAVDVSGSIPAKVVNLPGSSPQHAFVSAYSANLRGGPHIGSAPRSNPNPNEFLPMREPVEMGHAAGGVGSHHSSAIGGGAPTSSLGTTGLSTSSVLDNARRALQKANSLTAELHR